MATSTVFALAFASALASASTPLTPFLVDTFPVQSAAPQFTSFGAAPLTIRSIAQPESSIESQPEFAAGISTDVTEPSPRSGGQLYLQRLSALKIGKLYTRLPSDSFAEIWRGANVQPTYQQWRQLLALESKAVSKRRSDRDLSILLGDSLSLWYPSDRLQSSHLWLNQGISGDTTWNILARLPDLANTRPSQVYLMAGINDLKMGATDSEIVWNIQRIITQLQQMHPNVKIVVESILPTRSPRIPNERIVGINRQLSEIAQQAGATYLDLFAQFVDQDGQILSEYTTDGVHLSAQGYAAWQTVVQESSSKVALSSMSSN